MVRQRWDKWNVDAVLPMIYNSFYDEEVNWIGYATGQGVADLKSKNTELHTGIYVPNISAEDLDFENFNLSIFQTKAWGFHKTKNHTQKMGVVCRAL